MAQATTRTVYSNSNGLTVNPGVSASQQHSETLNVKDFGASGSDQTIIGSISAGSNTLTLAAPIDFKNGEGISIANAGPLPTISIPTIVAVRPTGETGATRYTYAVAALDIGNGLTTSVSASTTTGNTTLSSTNYNAINIKFTTGDKAYAIYRTAGGPSQGFIGMYCRDSTSNIFRDTGLPVITPPFGIPSSAPSSAIGEILVTSVMSGAGTTSLLLAKGATTSADMVAVRHNDTIALQSASIAAGNIRIGAVVYLPPGTYVGAGNMINVPSNVTVTGASTDLTVLTDLGFRIFGKNVCIENLSNSYTRLPISPPFEIDDVHDALCNDTIKNVNVTNATMGNFLFAFEIHAWRGGHKLISGVLFNKCKALNVPGSGFGLCGEQSQTAISNVKFIDCVASQCGYNSQYSPWSVGFDLGENQTATSNIEFDHCEASYCWESGFHQEVSSTYTKITYNDCVSHDNGQKPRPAYGDGFLIAGDTTLVGCTSYNNKSHDYHIEQGNVHLQHCIPSTTSSY